jgi:NADPH:quinone reductase-like Zn-dependent oxidoreductase
MKAAYYDRYGDTEVISIRELPIPVIGDTHILVKVKSSAVSTADWRFRTSNFPGVFWLPGRLMAGLFRPRRKVLGTDFAGEVVKTGASVDRFDVGDRVFGFCMHGGHAEYLAIDAEKAISKIPDSLDFDMAAAVPFGALAALVFLRDFAKVQAGQKVLIVGASGGVGVFAVQLARLMGAEVTGVSSAKNLDLVRSLGADHVIDYNAEDFCNTGEYDVILDTVAATSFGECKPALTANGLFIPLEFGLREIWQTLMTSMRRGKKVIVNVSGDSAKDMDYLSDLLERGEIRPVIDAVYPLDQIAEAHARVEGRHKTGAVVVSVSNAITLGLAAE